MSAITIQGLSKQYHLSRQDRPVFAVEQMDLKVEAGSTVALLGPSGCGKTTTLRCIAGLESPDAGRITIGPQVVFDQAGGVAVPAHRRHLGMVFQSYALWPHLRVAENVAFPLRKLKLTRAQVQERVRRVLESVDVARLADRYPGQLSGGQQQRVALARALVAEPAVILFDEPLSNLDTKLREQMRWELMNLRERVGFTAVYVTHDRTEALTLADRVVVMSAGRIVQNGTPAEVYHWPVNPFVADFMGDVNLLPGNADLGEQTLQTPFGVVHAGTWQAVPVAAPGSDFWPQGKPPLVAAFRPDAGVLAAPGGAGTNAWQAVVRTRAFLGSQFTYIIDLAGHSAKVIITAASAAYEPGQAVTITVPPEQVIVFEKA